MDMDQSVCQDLQLVKSRKPHHILLLGVLVGLFLLLGQLVEDLPDAETELGVLVFFVVGDDHVLDLVTPEEAVFLGVLGDLPQVQELDDAVLANVVGVFLGLVPVHGGSERQQTHCDDSCVVMLRVLF